MKRYVALLAALPLLAACTPAPQGGSQNESSSSAGVVSSAMMESSVAVNSDAMEESSPSSTEAMDNDTVYAAFSESVIGNGETSVLFFHAPWCPYCKAHDTDLTQWYSEQDFPYSTYKVDYDSSISLRQRYGVVTQHTFVLIDGEGNEIKKISNYPSDDQLLELLRS